MSVLLKFRFEYDAKLEGEQLTRALQLWPNLKVKGDGTVENTWEYFYGTPNVVYSIPGIKMREITRVDPLKEFHIAGLEDTSIEQLAREPSVTQINKKVKVKVPGNGLLRINTVKVLEDCCTDKLQEELDAGWQIVAVCPQPDQRRPDYVMGRHYEPSTGF